ncbi:putative survival factor 1 protein [Eutypa lata UCREL1]|uniref:Putative survival factor 1 protein n=1 Tax=Eutypa lata (strain UCR-EL1) TaxID=1287681 RepID=M7SBB4_EUTLA|nr:putative survival factor 1 protein [Eutypa lata UCREL1]
MFNWAKQTLANVVGTEEPIYGPSAIKSIAEDAKQTPYTELTRDDMKWITVDGTSVETQTFYLMAESGHIAFVQVIYSNVVGIRTTCQFNTKIFYPDRSKPILWSSTPLHDVDFSDDKTSFYAQDCAMELSEDGKSYTIKSMNDQKCIVNVKVAQAAPGFVAGKNGTTLYGTDLSNPWGTMRHAFWPRCVGEGQIVTEEGPIDFKGPAFFSHALQGMKPHHAAARWNFANFQSPNYSAILMEFTTPPSYGSTVVGVGGIAKDGEIIAAGSITSVEHKKTKQDSTNDWPEPTEIKFTWTGTAKDGKPVEAVIEGALEDKLDRIDVMAEVPGFVKTIVATAVGTKPYIYQFSPKAPTTLKLKIGEQEVSEEGRLFSEATFISEIGE